MIAAAANSSPFGWILTIVCGGRHNKVPGRTIISMYFRSATSGVSFGEKLPGYLYCQLGGRKDSDSRVNILIV
jgi:hypothetical protein